MLFIRTIFAIGLMIRASLAFHTCTSPDTKLRPLLFVRDDSSIRLRSTDESTDASSTNAPNTGDKKYPRAAVSTAVRCHIENAFSEPHYLLIQRGNPPNAGKWSFPGGKLEWGETTIQGAQRELAEETSFSGQERMEWHPDPFATADSIISPDNDNSKEEPLFHFVVAIAFATLQADALPSVTSKDDAKQAKWWTISEIQDMSHEMTTPGLVQRVERAEFLYQKGALL